MPTGQNPTPKTRGVRPTAFGGRRCCIAVCQLLQTMRVHGTGVLLWCGYAHGRVGHIARRVPPIRHDRPGHQGGHAAGPVGLSSAWRPHRACDAWPGGGQCDPVSLNAGTRWALPSRATRTHEFLGQLERRKGWNRPSVTSVRTEPLVQNSVRGTPTRRTTSPTDLGRRSCCTSSHVARAACSVCQRTHR